MGRGGAGGGIGGKMRYYHYGFDSHVAISQRLNF